VGGKFNLIFEKKGGSSSHISTQKKERWFVNACRNSCGRDGRPPMPPQSDGRMSMPPQNCGYQPMSNRMGQRIDERNRYLEDLPLAMAYVPFQEWREIYPPDEALSIGTIFKELNLPFYGRRPCK
jgi:hypothetical protein